MPLVSLLTPRVSRFFPSSRLTSSSQSYEQFVASLGGDIERVGADGSNALSNKTAAAAPAPMPALLAALANQQAEERAAHDQDRAAASSDLIAPARPKAASSSSSSFAASSSSSAVAAAAAPSAASSASSTAFGSDFLTLMKLLADDRDRMRENKTLITGDDEIDAANAAAAAGGQTLSPKRPDAHLAAAAASFAGDHIRVDDSYGFTPDPFAPESRPPGGASMGEEDDDAEDPLDAALHEEEDRARIRVLGEEPEDECKRKSRSEQSEDDENEDPAAADPDLITAPRRGIRPSTSALRGSPLESALFLSEEDAGASLESVPVEADYEYRAEADKMSLLEFRAAQAAAASAKAAASPKHKRRPSADSTALTTERADGPLSAPPPSLVDRAASRLGADAAIAAAAAASVDASTAAASVSSVPDEVESFSYRPESFDPHADAETEAASAEEQREDEAKLPATPKMQLSPKLSAAASSSSSVPTLSAAARLMSRPVVMRPPTSSFLDAADDDDDDGFGVETVDLEHEPSTSVAILSVAAASSASSSSVGAAASIRPPTAATHGNFLDRSAQMGFEHDDDDDKTAAARNAAASSSFATAADVDDGDVSEEEGEWISVEEAMARINDPAPASAATPAYTPSAQSSGQQRPRRTLPK